MRGTDWTGNRDETGDSTTRSPASEARGEGDRPEDAGFHEAARTAEASSAQSSFQARARIRSRAIGADRSGDGHKLVVIS